MCENIRDARRVIKFAVRENDGSPPAAILRMKSGRDLYSNAHQNVAIRNPGNGRRAVQGIASVSRAEAISANNSITENSVFMVSVNLSLCNEPAARTTVLALRPSAIISCFSMVLL